MKATKVIKWFIVSMAIVLLTACGGGSGDNPTAKEIAIAHIMEYAQNGETPPTLQDYLDAGVTGVTEDNLDEINEVVENLTSEDVDTEEEVQALADELGVVLPDTTVPVITLTGSANVSFVQGGTYTEEGATATDDRDGDLTANIVIAGTVDTSVVASYTVTYTVSDSAGNGATVNRIVNVVAAPDTPDTTPPTFTSSASASVNENQTSAITLVATDNESTVTYSISGTDVASFSVDASTGVVTFDTAPDYETKASYTFTATATDDSSNVTTQTVTITILDVCEASATPISHNNTDGYKEVCSPYTEKIWLDRNLGAARVCIGRNDTECYGDYYQWGRNYDGHENNQSDITDTLASQIDPVQNTVYGKFIKNRLGYRDWTSAVDSNGSERSAKWSTTDGDSICPNGYRVPTIAELKAELLDPGSEEIADGGDAYRSFLKLPQSGYRYTNTNTNEVVMYGAGVRGGIWSSSVEGEDYSSRVYFATNPGRAGSSWSPRSTGYPVRCIKSQGGGQPQ